MLVYYEVFSTMTEAITQEKQLKLKRRQKKLDLIQAFNPTWEDLYEKIIF